MKLTIVTDALLIDGKSYPAGEVVDVDDARAAELLKTAHVRRHEAEGEVEKAVARPKGEVAAKRVNPK